MAAVVALDQLTKHTIGTSIAPGHVTRIVPGVLTLVYERNTGVAFSELSGAGWVVYVPIAAALVAVVAWLIARPGHRWLWLPTGMMLGGAVGNLIDRIANGSVIDFIKLPHWPAFNFADISITFGAIALALVIELGARRGGGMSEQPDVPRVLVVGDGEAGQRLDRFLSGPLGSRARAARMIEAGAVRVDGRALPKRHEVRAGERVEIAPEEGRPRPEIAEPAPFTVAYEDEHLIVVDKPAGVVVHPARGHRTGTLAQALAGRSAGGDDPGRSGIVHRLDRDTSGLLVVAKTDEIHRALGELLQARELHRQYLALVDGLPPARTGTIDAPIGRDRRERVINSLDSDRPRPATTHFTVVRVLRGSSLLEVVLDTGRTHQIRVHMAAIGHPVIGDRMYGGPVRYGLGRQFLHAARLAFPHPIGGAPVDVSSPLPADLAAALAVAERETMGPGETATSA